LNIFPKPHILAKELGGKGKRVRDCRFQPKGLEGYEVSIECTYRTAREFHPVLDDIDYQPLRPFLEELSIGGNLRQWSVTLQDQTERS
jgi:hypothetical protein